MDIARSLYQFNTKICSGKQIVTLPIQQRIRHENEVRHYNEVIISAMVSQITSPSIFHLTVYSSTNGRKHQKSTSLAFVRGIHGWLVNSPHKRPVTRKMFPFDGVIISWPKCATIMVSVTGKSYLHYKHRNSWSSKVIWLFIVLLWTCFDGTKSIIHSYRFPFQFAVL